MIPSHTNWTLDPTVDMDPAIPASHEDALAAAVELCKRISTATNTPFNDPGPLQDACVARYRELRGR